jgi:small-conductance mechanosensitive channel
MSWASDLLGGPPWPLGLILGYPLAAVVISEIARRIADRAPFASSTLRQVAYVVLPIGTIWLILRGLADLPVENDAVRIASTAFALTALYILLRVAQATLMKAIGDQTRAPKLLFDTLRIGLVLLCGAIVISSVWHVDLASLITALGAGSIVLAFALQEFLGNLLSGLGLLSAHKFGIGDWIVVDGRPVQVVEMDWHTVTLAGPKGSRIVVANSTLAKGNLTIAARANQPVWAEVPLKLPIDVPPEQVRDAVLEAGSTVPDLVGSPAVRCEVTGIDQGEVNYLVSMSIANPGILRAPRDEFLSRFWYVAQRRGIPLEEPSETNITLQRSKSGAPDEAAHQRLLEESGAFRRNPEVLPLLARVGNLRRYRRGDILLAEGAVATDVLLVVAGLLGTWVAKDVDDIRLELVGAGQLLVFHEMLVGGPSSARIVAEKDTDVLAIPATAVLAALDTAPMLARDIGALTEARRQATTAARRGIRKAA